MRPGQEDARTWRVAELPVHRGKLECELRSVADSHEEGRRVVGIGFGSSCEQQLIPSCCACRFARGPGLVTPGGEDLRMDSAILGVVGDIDQRRDQRGSGVQVPARQERPRRDARARERARAISPRAGRRSLPHVPGRRGAWRSRPIRTAAGRMGEARCHDRHRAPLRSSFRPPPIDSFPRAGLRARRRCRFRDVRSPVCSRRTSASLNRPVAWNSAARSASASRAG